jgi:hypothetical protein
MEKPVILRWSEAHRFAFRFRQRVIRAIVPIRTRGAYLLLSGENPLYIGRSDHCVQSRLAGHPLLGIATHFLWEPCGSSVRAFCLEAFWYHRLAGELGGLILIHPASPVGSGFGCPFCSMDDEAGLADALRHHHLSEPLASVIGTSK